MYIPSLSIHYYVCQYLVKASHLGNKEEDETKKNQSMIFRHSNFYNIVVIDSADYLWATTMHRKHLKISIFPEYKIFHENSRKIHTENNLKKVLQFNFHIVLPLRLYGGLQYYQSCFDFL